MATAVKIALDWTPSGNHIGFYTAKAKGLYSAASLDVTFLSPHADAYKATPASRVESGEALLAVCPSETVISYNLRPPSMPKPGLKAVSALLQIDNSAIVTLKSSGIDSPAKLEGKRYASYGARYEGRIVQQMIKADGGSGEYQELALPMLGLWDTVLTGDADATWVFMGWEGVEAKLKGVELNSFVLGDYGIPYGYSPVLVAHPDAVQGQADLLTKVLAATAEGYIYAAGHPDEAAELMAKIVAEECPDLPTPIDINVLKGSAQVVKECSLNGDGKWGHMEADRWDTFLDWLSEQGLLTTKVQSRGGASDDTTSLDGLRGGDAGEPIPRNSVKAETLFTNDFLP